MKAVEQRVRNIVAMQACASEEDVTNTADLQVDLGMDSIDKIEMCMSLEEEFGFSIDEEEADNWKTFDDVVEGVEKLTKKSTKSKGVSK